MKDELSFDIAVIGAGAAGQMGALRGVLNNRSVVAFSGSAKTNKRSRATWVSKVVNMPYTAPILRPITNATKDTFKWIKEESDFKENFIEHKEEVTKLSKNAEGSFSLETETGKTFQAKFVLLATGIMDIQPEIEGSIRPVLPYANNGHVDYCVRCDGHKAKGKITATIGHGSTAAFVAAMLHERYQPPEIKIFTNGHEPDFSDDAKALVELYKIKIIKEPIVSIIGDPKTKMEAFELKAADGSKKSEAVEIAFAMLGQIAYNELAKQVGAECNTKGNVVCNAKGESSIAGLYVAGDLRDTGKYQIYTAWDQAVDSVDDMDLKLRLAFRDALRMTV